MPFERPDDVAADPGETIERLLALGYLHWARDPAARADDLRDSRAGRLPLVCMSKLPDPPGTHP